MIYFISAFLLLFPLKIFLKFAFVCDVYSTQEAIALLKTLITSKSATFGDLSAEVGEAYKLYGSILMSQGQLEKALKFFKKVA